MNPSASMNPSAGQASQLNWMPLAHWNLGRNPFGELTREERAEVAIVDVDSITPLVQNDHRAVQFIGDCGRGKTTRMLALHRVLTDSTYAYLPEHGPCPSIAAGRPVMIDEAQRLPRRIRKQIFALGLPLVLATHRDLTRPLKRVGYQVVTFHIGDGNDPMLVYQALNRRIQASCLNSQQPVPELSMDDATELVNRFGSDVRAMEGYLYDIVQTQAITCNNPNHTDLTHGKMRFID